VADVRLYPTPIAMDDLDDVRAALGYSRINLYGISYGAQAALQYVRRHPTRLRSVILAGVLTPAAKQPLQFARAAQHAMDLLIGDCAAEAACARTFPDLRADFAAALAAFERGPVTFVVSNPVTQAVERVCMLRGVLVDPSRLLLYNSDTAIREPSFIVQDHR